MLILHFVISVILCASLQVYSNLAKLKCMVLSLNAAGMDFSNTSLDLTYSPSSLTQNLMVSILNDGALEDMLEYFSLVLMSTDPAVSLTPKIANITIVDDGDSKFPWPMCTV